MNTVAIVQARINSKRFPNKVLKKINKKTIIEIINDRLKKSKKIDKIIFAIPRDSSQKKLLEHLNKIKASFYRGKEKNVLDRYYNAAKFTSAVNIVRITADCPLIDYKLLDKIINFYHKNKRYDYISNTINPTFPDGLDIEIFSFKALTLAWKNSKTIDEKEHVTKYLLENNKIKKYSYQNKKDYSDFRWTIDAEVDYTVIKKIFNNFKGKTFGWNDALNFCIKNKKVLVNSHLSRNYKSMSEKNKLWEKAKNFIPEGNSMISKHPDLYLPNLWPTYFNKAKGCSIWGLDKKKYYDLSIMSAGTNILGYSNSDVNKSVISAIKNGNMSTLNCPEEVMLAEKLILINPWADKVLFARTGGEANAMAVRLARAYTGKDKIAFCGYHGWHDWFLAASKKNQIKIKKEHLSFYSSLGVPRAMRDSVLPFEYNNTDSLEELISKHKDIGTIKMEVERNEKPKNNFLEKIRKIATKNNLVLIFDECTTGFRETFGGIHQKYNVNPDIVIFGKALGNGFPITSIVGKKDIMDMKKKTFMSSTFWTERSGPTAALKTLEIMEKLKSWEIITKKGYKIQEFWKKLGKKYNLQLTVQGIPSLTNFQFNTKYHSFYKTFITSEMLKKGYLANNIVYSSISHSEKILKKY